MIDIQQKWLRGIDRSDEISAFVSEWVTKSVVEGFAPRWEFVTKKRRVWIDWTQVANERRLMRLSKVAEKQYLAKIAFVREAWVREKKKTLSETQALISFERYMCKHDLYYLTKYILGYADLVFHLHKTYAEAQEDLPRPCREIREAPRGSFKSTIWTIGWCVQQILRNPNISILIISNSDPLASAKLEEIKKHFISPRNPLCMLFPEVCCQKTSDQGSGSIWRVPNATRATSEGTIEAAGVGTSKTGRHYDVLLGDDFWNEKSVTSREATEKVESALKKLNYLLINQNTGQIIFVDTRFAHDDPTEGLKKAGYNPVIVSGILPCGRPLFPERASLATYGEQLTANGVYDFSCQIMLNPTVGDMAFKREWFQYLSFEKIKQQRDEGELAYRTVILTDAAADGKSSSDFIAIGVVVCDSLKRRTLVSYVREKMVPSDFLRAVEQQVDKWQPEAVVRQKTSLETAIASFAAENEVARREGGKIAVPWYNYSLHKREKKMRITASLQPRLSNGQLFFDPALPHLAELENEFLTHPNSRNDDGIDMLAMLDDEYLSRCPEPPKHAPVKTTDNERIDKVIHDLLTCRPEDLERDWRLERREMALQYLKQGSERRKKRR